MYCPNCGQSNEIEQRFCRRRGLNLEAVSETLSTQLLGGNVEPIDGRLEKFGNFALGGLGVIGLAGAAGLIYTIITRYILSGQSVIFGIFVSLFIVFAVLALIFVILNEHQKEKMAKRSRPPVEPKIEAPSTGKLLNTGRFEPVPSVIEDTTELLKIENRTRKL